MEINGVAHVFITAGDFARSRAFYRQLLPYLGLKEVMDAAGTYYCVGGRTGFGVRAPPAGREGGERFDQGRVGLHHVCFRMREREEVDEAHTFLASIGAAIVHPPRDDDWAPGYYSVLFEDPDGVRLEINHVPGQGLLTPGGSGHLGGAWPQE
jgi:catechol 2,3-dioxygenase-like lactoylglutathione lyase family enzyme